MVLALTLKICCVARTMKHVENLSVQGKGLADNKHRKVLKNDKGFSLERFYKIQLERSTYSTKNL
jgi:hypothetical protein